VTDTISDGVLIVGAGYLGKLIVKEYKENFPGALVVAETR
jgi:hypothetical protein